MIVTKASILNMVKKSSVETFLCLASAPRWTGMSIYIKK